jgi:hypothetical protein
MQDRFFKASIIRVASVAVVLLASLAEGGWKPAEGPLMTRWAKEVSPDNVHPEYPRPQMVRPDWLNLNGLWDYAIRPKDAAPPTWRGRPALATDGPDGQILVPFPVESALSGVMRPVGPDNRLWYRRTFEIPKGRSWDREGRRILLHFGAVDWDATVWVNGKEVGNHKGGYDPFTFDITNALTGSGSQEIVLSVWDPTDAGTQPRGKQVRRPRGIWYTAVTGIWQTVWLEPVNPVYIKSIRMTPDVDAGVLRVRVQIGGDVSDPGQYNVSAALVGNPPQRIMAGSRPTGTARRGITDELEIIIERPKLWSPDEPHLYDLEIMLGREESRKGTAGRTTVDYVYVDQITTYFAMRKIALQKDENGINRLFLNNKPLFQYGPLDQGWWPDGLYTAPTDEALRYDIEVTKQLGMNMARKHVKIEPARWYYWCDKLGLLVWQDMPNGDRHIGSRDPDLVRTEESAKQFELELTRMIETFYNHPSIVMWVPFNEGWGQYDTARITDMVKKLDPTRLVNNASGWTDRRVGDVLDIHSYPGPAVPRLEANRAVVLGEFGGLGLPLPGHTWQAERNWGYRSYTTVPELTDAYAALIENLRPLIGRGLAAAVYTQTTDVEIEVNGLMTYDRAVIKMDAEKVRALSKRLYLPPPIIKTLVSTSQEDGQVWRYTTSRPPEGWQKPDFDDSAWKTGRGGFGTRGTPGAVVRTTWDTSDIWIRRTFDLTGKEFSRPVLLMHHDEDVEVYLNGRRIATRKGYTTDYIQIMLDDEALSAFRPGLNHIAIHCHQTTGGQYIDAGFVEVIERQ